MTQPRERLAGLVLAGGAGRRMGGADKPLLELGGRPMLAWILDRVRTEPVGAIALSANGDPARYAAFGLPVLDDGAFAGAGPLAGLLAGLDWAAGLGAELMLSVPGDTPFLPAGLVRRLAPAPACAAGSGPARGGTADAVRAHHLVALWPVAARAALRARLGADAARSVHGFAAAIGVRQVVFAEGPDDPFLNVNTGDDLAAARARIGPAGIDPAGISSPRPRPIGMETPA